MLTFELDRLACYSDEALLDELRRVAELIVAPKITRAAFDRYSKASSSALVRRFGGWNEAHERADLAERYSGTVVSTGRSMNFGLSFSDEELLAELQGVAAKSHGKPVTMELFNEQARMSAETIRRRFGSWWAALQAAGLQISSRGRRYSGDDYFENLLTVWTHYGRQPRYREMDAPPSQIPAGAYEAKWGNWTKALLAFIDRVNSDSQEDEPAPCNPSPQPASRTPQGPNRTKMVREEDQRNIRLGLRYEVLRRDRFRCVSCGASPATDSGCVLHVDHIIPYSRGGKTTLRNLRTLCEKCNLGKGVGPE